MGKTFRKITALLWCCASGAALVAGADIQTHLLGVNYRNDFSGYVLDSDASDPAPGYDRDAIPAVATVQFSTPPGIPATGRFRLDFQLVDETDAPLPIDTAAGSPGTAFQVTLDPITLPDPGPIPVTSFNKVVPARLRPAAALDSHRQYRVRMELFESRSAGTLPDGTPIFQWVSTGKTGFSGPRRIFHFRNPASADAALNVIGAIDSLTVLRDLAVATAPAQAAFQVNAGITLHRWDGFDAGVSFNAVDLTLKVTLREAESGTPVPLADDTVVLSLVMNNHSPSGGGVITPATQNLSQLLEVRPLAQLDSVNGRYTLAVSLSHVEVPGGPSVPDDAAGTAAKAWLHLNGTLRFGAIETVLTAVDWVRDQDVVPAGLEVKLSLPAGGGQVAGQPEHTFGGGTPLDAVLSADGTLTFTGAGAVPVTGPAQDVGRSRNVRFRRSGIALDRNGAHGDIEVILPTGLGYATTPLTRLFQGRVSLGVLGLAQHLVPRDSELSLMGALPTPFYLSDEARPLMIECVDAIWEVTRGRFRFGPSANGSAFVRAAAQNKLAAMPVSDPAMRLKRSNDQLFESAGAVLESPIVVAADARGRARTTLSVDLGPADFTSHFPYDVHVHAVSGGQLVVTNGVVDPDASHLAGIEAVAVAYPRDCLGANCGGGAGSDTLEMVPKGGRLSITGDGGLVGDGTLNAARGLQWGWISQSAIQDFAHQTDPWPRGTFAMAGVSLGGDEVSQAPARWPEALLLSGVSATDRAAAERPGSPSYAGGLGDYAGLNFRVGTDVTFQAKSLLGGWPTGDYPLTGRSKYYVRASGVTGIHEAAPGAFPSQARIYGYDFQFGNFGLSFRDSQNRESRTEGLVKVAYPSEFPQNFKELKFTCLGALDDAKVPADEAGVEKLLKYWKADFETLAIQFDRPAAAGCDPGVGYLTLGVKAHLPVAGIPLFGRLGFYGQDGKSGHTPGNLITRADAALDAPFDSRLKAPTGLSFQGPQQESYHLTPVNDAYFNNYDAHPQAQPAGVLNLAGRLDVPFFESLQVHIHTSADKEVDPATALLRFMGGWPNAGYSDGGKSFFTDNPFDTDNRGFPTDVTLADYELGNAGPAGRYRPRAQKRWLGVVDFDYPLNWSAPARSFTSFTEVTNELLVLNVRHRVRYLSAENAELTFGASYNEVPQIDVVNLNFDDLGGMQNVVDTAISVASRVAITAGMKELDGLLSTKADEQFQTALDGFVNPVVDNLYAALKADFDPATHAYRTGADGIVHSWFVGNPPMPGKRSVEGALKQMVSGGNGSEVNLVMSIDSKLGDVLPALDSVAKILQEVQGKKVNLAGMAKGIIGAKASQFLGSVVDSNVNALIDKLGGPLNQIGKVLARLNVDVKAARARLKPGQAFATFLTQQLNNRLPELQQAVAIAEGRVKARLAAMDTPVGSPFTDIPEADLKTQIRQEIETAFFGTSIVASMQEVIRQELYDLDASIREAVDSLFQQVNLVVRDLITPSLASADNSVEGFSADLSTIAGAGKVQGYAHINGDSLKLLRLDVYGQLKLPSKLEFNGYLQIKELDSEGSGAGCLPPGGKATEVTLAALDVPVKWIASGVNASVKTKFTFDTTGSVPVLLNLGGGVDLKGEIKIETLKIKQASMALAFGQQENYISAAARVQINKYEGMGGLMFGRTCSLDPLSWDKDVAAILGQPNPTFTGAYAYGEVWIPLSEALLGIPASCVFQISASTGAGAGFFIEGPTFVGKMMMGLSGDVLCIASAQGEVKMTGVKNADGLNLRGAGKLTAKVGWCPICLKFSKSVSMEYKNDSWSVDF